MVENRNIKKYMSEEEILKIKNIKVDLEEF